MRFGAFYEFNLGIHISSYFSPCSATKLLITKPASTTVASTTNPKVQTMPLNVMIDWVIILRLRQVNPIQKQTNCWNISTRATGTTKKKQRREKTKLRFKERKRAIQHSELLMLYKVTKQMLGIYVYSKSLDLLLTIGYLLIYLG